MLRLLREGDLRLLLFLRNEDLCLLRLLREGDLRLLTDLTIFNIAILKILVLAYIVTLPIEVDGGVGTTEGQVPHVTGQRSSYGTPIFVF